MSAKQLPLFKDLPKHSSVIGFPGHHVGDKLISVQEAIGFIDSCYAVCLVGYHGEDGDLRVVSGNTNIKGAVYMMRQAEAELL